MNGIGFKLWEADEGLVLKKLDTSQDGLSEKEAIRRRRKYGLNEIASQKKRGAFMIFISQFKNPLFAILFLAALVSGFLGEFKSSVIIILMLGFTSIISFFQEYRSEKTIELLKKQISLKATVIRNGKQKSILASELVPGDIVVLNFGDVLPADIRLTEIDDLAINESVLTGESFPVEKTSEPIKVPDHLPQAMKNIGFMGTHVVQGSGIGVVAAIGGNTEFGRTAKLLETKEEKTEFQKGIADFSMFLFKIILIFSFAVFIFLALFRGNWLESLLFTLSIAVGISPELLPMIITINLSRAAKIMAKNGVVVKKLIAIEDLGNADILCADKTGTLTEGKIFLKSYFDFLGKKDEKIICLASLCSEAVVNKSKNINPLDGAIADYAKKYHCEKFTKNYKVIDDVAFDFKRRRMSVVLQNTKRLIITKGASKEMLDVCGSVEIGNKNEKISKHLKAIRERIKTHESQGFKTLLVAYKEIGIKKKYSPSDEKDLILMGFLIFSDPPKKTASESLAKFRKLGVNVKLLTGDTVEAAQWLATETGFVFKKVVSGQDLDKMNQEKFKKTVLEFDVFAKVTPEHKLKIIKALKELGKNVAFLGDGINDAPALRAADVGISVSTGSDVAKEATDVVLLKKSLRVLIGGIKEGRRTFGNTLKYIFCTISSNYGNMFSVVGASVILPFIPLLPAQVLLLNFLSDFPLLAVSTDRVDDDYLKKPKHWDIGIIKKFMNYFGLISSAFDFLTYGFLLLIVHASMPLFQVGWFWQSFLTEVLLIFVIRTRKWFWQGRPSKTLVAAFFVTIVIILSIMYTSLADYFGFARMPIWVNLSMVGMALGYFFVVEATKKFFFKRYDI